MRPHVLSDEDVTEEMMKRTWLTDPPKKTEDKKAPGTYRESLVLACKEYQGQ